MSNMEISLCNSIIKSIIISIKEINLFLKNFSFSHQNLSKKTLIETILKDNHKQIHLLNELYLGLNKSPIIEHLTENDTTKFKTIESAEAENYAILQSYYKLRSIVSNSDFKSLISSIILYGLGNSNRFKILTSDHSSKTKRTSFTKKEALEIAEKIGLDFDTAKFNIDEFVTGLGVELEHGTASPITNVTNDNPYLTGKIAWAHLLEFPDYYTRLSKLEDEAKAYWQSK